MNAQQTLRSDRRISVGITVEDVKDLPKVGAYLKRFLTEVDVPHGPFDLTFVLSVGGYEFSPVFTFVPAEEEPQDNEEEGDG